MAEETHTVSVLIETHVRIPVLCVYFKQSDEWLKSHALLTLLKVHSGWPFGEDEQEEIKKEMMRA